MIKRILLFVAIISCFEQYGMQSFISRTKQKGTGQQFRQPKKKKIPFFVSHAAIGMGVGMIYAFKTKYYNELKDQPIIQDIVKDVLQNTSQEIVCNTKLPLYDWLVEKIEKNIYYVLAEEKSDDKLVEEINNIVIMHIKELMEQKTGLTEENAKKLVKWSSAIVGFVLLCASARAWHNLGALGFTIGSLISFPAGEVTGEIVGQMLFDKKRILRILSRIYHTNVESIELVLRSIISEIFAVSQEEFARRQAGILYIYSNKLNLISEEELKKIEHEKKYTGIIIKNMQYFFHEPEIRLSMKEALRDSFNLMLDYYQNKGSIRYRLYEWLLGLEPVEREIRRYLHKKRIESNEEFFQKIYSVIIPDEKFFQKLASVPIKASLDLHAKILLILFLYTINTCENPIYNNEEIAIEAIPKEVE